MTVGDSDISLFPSPCFRFLSPTFALFASFLFSLSQLSFPSLASFARFFRLSFFPLPSFARSTPFRILFPGFSLSLPVFTASAPRFFGFSSPFLLVCGSVFVVSFRLFIARKTHSANPADAHEQSPDSTPFSARYTWQKTALRFGTSPQFTYICPHTAKRQILLHTLGCEMLRKYEIFHHSPRIQPSQRVR